MDRWSSGRVGLLGDAAFSSSPFSGGGTGLALVGAYLPLVFDGAPALLSAVCGQPTGGLLVGGDAVKGRRSLPRSVRAAPEATHRRHRRAARRSRHRGGGHDRGGAAAWADERAGSPAATGRGGSDPPAAVGRAGLTAILLMGSATQMPLMATLLPRVRDRSGHRRPARPRRRRRQPGSETKTMEF
jgi:hypothetical protein